MKTKKKFLSFSLALVMLATTMFQSQWMDVHAEPVVGDSVIDTEQELREAVALGGDIVIGDDIDLSTAVEVTKDVVLDLNHKSLTIKEDTEGNGVFCVTDGTLTINGDGTIDGVGKNDYNMAIWANGGDVVINGGHYTNTGITGTDDHYDLIYAKNGSTITINGGSFECKTPKWTLNCHDSSGAQIIVKGGTFKDYNPAEVYTEPTQPKNFLPEGFKAVVDESGVFTVAEEVVEGKGCRVCGSAMRFVNSTEPTCSSLGNYAYWTCSNYDCEEANEVVFLDEECTVAGTFDEAMIPMVEHELIERTVDKCGGNGTFAYYVCKYPNCSLEKAFSENNFESEIVLPELKAALGHELINIAEIIPTCQKEGMAEHVQCTKCNKHFTDNVYYLEVTEDDMVLPKLEHVWDDGWFSDENEHWRQCTYLGCKNEVSEHTYDQEVVNEEWRAADANCAHGTLYYKSCVCGKVGTATFEVGEPLPNHNLKTSWTFDENNHWYECETEGCGYKESVTEHTFDLIVMEDEYLASAANCQNKAKYFMSCECGAAGTETVEDQNGEFGDHVPADEWTKERDTHYHKCTVDGCNGKVAEAIHEWEDKEIVKLPTTEEMGMKIVKCKVCGYEREEGIPMLEDEHNWNDTLSSDSTHHWYDCTDEGCEEQKDKAEHAFIKEVAEEKYLNTPATCVKKATYFKSCECGAKGTETFEAGELSTTHDVDKTTLLKDGTNHWYACKVEGCEYKENLAAHVFDKEVATADFEASKATCQTKAQYYKSCVCGKAGTDKFESGELAKHVMGTTYEKDETGHWTKCTTTGCTEKSKVEDHVFKDGKTKCETCGYEKTHVCELKAVDAKKATCEKAGNIAHYKCAECSKLFKDKDGKEELKDEDVIVAKTEHKNTWFITKAATKDKVGEFKGKCSVCGTTTTMDLEKLGTSGKLTIGSDDDNEFDAKLATEDAYMLVELTTDEVKEINDGKDFNILLTVEDLDKDITKSEKEDMEDAMKEKKLTLGKYLDITLTKQLLDGKKVEDSEAVVETSDDVKIVFELTDALLNKDDKVTRTYKVLRLHDGKVTVIDAEYDKDDKTVTFETDQFSTYALTYQDKDKDGKVVETEKENADSASGTVMPDAGDNMNVILYALAAGLSMTALAGYFVYNKKKNKK